MTTLTLSRRALLAGAAATLALPAIPASAATRLRLAHVAPARSSYQEAAELFGGRLGELTGGEVDVQILPGGTLGDLKQLWAQLRLGVIDFHLIDPAAMVALDEAAAFRVLSQPFVFDDQAHFERFVGSDVFAEEMGKIEAAAGIRWVGYLGPRAPRGISTTDRPVRTVEDLKGLRLRLFENPIAIDAFKTWGANPIAVQASEIYTSIETGMVEGQDNGLIDTVNMGLVPIQKYFITLDWLISGIGLWMNAAKWNALGADAQEHMRAAALHAREAMTAAYEADLAAKIAEMEAAGIEIIEPDRAGFRAALESTLPQKEGTVWPAGLYEKIRAL